ncbi:MAG: cupin domain-containing protein [bacterium]
MTAADIIKLLDLKPLPEEGGLYRENYRSDEMIPANGLPARYGKTKCFCTAIYYLLTPDNFSAIHRVPSEEIFHFYLGDPVTMLQLHADGRSETVTLGQDIVAGQQLQVIVQRGVWQGAFLNKGGAFALMGTTVAPGFDFSDYESAAREPLLEKYPDRAGLIEKLTAPAV